MLIPRNRVKETIPEHFKTPIPIETNTKIALYQMQGGMDLYSVVMRIPTRSGICNRLCAALHPAVLWDLESIHLGREFGG